MYVRTQCALCYCVAVESTGQCEAGALSHSETEEVSQIEGQNVQNAQVQNTYVPWNIKGVPCVRAYVCVCTYLCVCRYVCVCRCMCARMCVCMCDCVCIYVCACACLCVCVCVRACASLCVCICTYIMCMLLPYYVVSSWFW